MPRITISYRREDSLGITGRIFDRLAAQYGRGAVYRDLDNIPVGVDFRSHIGKALAETDVLIAVIGARWRGPRGGPNRLMSGSDPVRVEVETALRKEMPLIPVLVAGGTMPSVEQLPEPLHSFAYRNALTIDAGKDFEVHMARLFTALTEIIGSERASDSAPVAPEPSRPLHADAGVTKSAELAAITLERDALREERDALLVELERLRERERLFRMELNYTADESAATQRHLDEADFAASLEVSRRSFQRLWIASGIVFAFLGAVVFGVCFYAFAH